MRSAIYAVVMGVLPTVALAKPPIFTEATYEEAVKTALEQNKLLVVHASATWSTPCQRLDATTWNDAKLSAWMWKNAEAVQFDVDGYAHIADALKIEAMPTIIAFKDGKEVERIIGYRNADEMLRWLEGVKRGEREADSILKQLTGPAADDFNTRYRVAQQLIRAGHFSHATDQLLWLWRHMAADPALHARQREWLRADLEQLLERYEPGRQRFKQTRDATQKFLRGGAGSWDRLVDWMVLNEILQETERTLEWFDGARRLPGAAGTFAQLEPQLEKVLVMHERWADLSLVYGDPVEAVKRHRKLLPATPTSAHVKGFHERCALIYVSTLASKRYDAANEVVVATVKMLNDRKAGAKLVQWAVEAGYVHPSQLRVLDEAQLAGADVDPIRMQLQGRLRQASVETP